MNIKGWPRLLACQRALLTLAIILVAASAARAAEPQFLSDVVLGIGTYSGDMGLDTSSFRIWPVNIPGKPIKIAEKTYEKGIGLDGGNWIMVALDGAYASFDAEVGVQTPGLVPASGIAFEVYVDGVKKYESGPMAEGEPAKPVSVPLEGAQEMKLVTLGSGQCNWAAARLTPRDGAAAAEPLDMARFARVVGFDPDRKTGAGVSRLEEIPAEDIFLETDLAPNPDGSYAVPRAADGQGCIGLQWSEVRRLKEVGLEFVETPPQPPFFVGGGAPSPEGARVECWMGLGTSYVSGESNWQGSWKPLKGQIRQEGSRWIFPIADETRRIRWIFPAGAELRIKRLWSLTNSTFDSADVQFQLESPRAGQTAKVTVYNGEILAPAGQGAPLACEWNLGEPLKLKVRYTKPRANFPFWQLDRTVLRVELPDGAFGVALDDLLPEKFPLPTDMRQVKWTDDVVEDLHPLGVVYVKAHGFFASADPAKITLADYRKLIEGRATILDQVRRAPDQTFGAAVTTLYDPRQDACPTQISLAWDNRKVVVDRDGAVHYGPEKLMFVEYKHQHELKPRIGARAIASLGASASASDLPVTRTLEQGWLPIPRIAAAEGGIEYAQATMVTPFDADGATSAAAPYIPHRPLALSEFTIRNAQSAPATATLSLTFSTDVTTTRQLATLSTEGGRIIARRGAQVLAVVEPATPAALDPAIEGGTLTLRGELAPGAQAIVYAYMPVEWQAADADLAAMTNGPELRRRCEQFWAAMMAPAIQIDLPDDQLENLIRASQVHCMNTAHSEDNGLGVEPRIAATYYGSLDTESHAIIHGMDLLGQTEFARRGLNYFVKRHNPAGYFVHGYTMMGSGQHMRFLSDHYRLTGDGEWWRGLAPKLDKMVDWTIAQAEKTKRKDPAGQKLPEYGLMPPGTVADWQHWGFMFNFSGHFYAGMLHAGQALSEIGDPAGEKAVKFAETLRAEIVRALKWTQSRMPVRPLRDGTWVSGSPFEVYSPGPIQQFFPNYNISVYDAILGMHHLGAQGVLAPDSPEIEACINQLEDIEFLKPQGHDNVQGSYLAARKDDPLMWGGVIKSQPYYMRYLDILAMRDDVKPYIRSYLNTAAMSFNREDQCFWEGVWASSVWNKTAETGGFLQQSRTMLVQECGNELWLAPFAVNHWMKDGQSIAVSQAPTFFGPVGYRITSRAAQGMIEATIDPPTRKAPEAIVIRLRHPDGKPMKKVTVNGADWTRFDAARETVRLDPAPGPIQVRAEY